MSASLCAPAIRWSNTSGLRAASANATAGSRWIERAIGGTATAKRTTPPRARKRRPTTEASRLWCATTTIQPSTTRKSGPYGEVRWFHSGSTRRVKGVEPITLVPYRYGLRPCDIISPWAA